MGRPYIYDLKGQKMGGWLVLNFSKRIKIDRRSLYYWEVQCQKCGFKREFQGSNLKKGTVACCSHAMRRKNQLPYPIYMPISGFNGYVAGSEGSIWSCHVSGARGGLRDIWRKLSPRLDKNGYPSVILCSTDGKRHTKRISHLVLDTFVGRRPEGFESCHYPDPDPLNNHIKNLRWGTHKENMHDKTLQNRQAHGETHGCVKLTEKEILEIRHLRIESGMFFAELGKRFGISSAQACAIVKRRSWSHI